MQKFHVDLASRLAVVAEGELLVLRKFADDGRLDVFGLGKLLEFRPFFG